MRVDLLLLLALVDILLHTEIKNFLCQAVESREVLIAEGEANVPGIWIGSRSVQEDAVVFNQPRLLLRVPDRFDIRFQVVHERVEMSGQYLDQRDPSDSPFGVLVLCHGSGDRQQRETEYRNCEPDSLLHSTIDLLEIDAAESNRSRGLP